MWKSQKNLTGASKLKLPRKRHWPKILTRALRIPAVCSRSKSCMKIHDQYSLVSGLVGVILLVSEHEQSEGVP